MSDAPRNAPDPDERADEHLDERLDEYLVHRRGSPDPDVERLERLLAPLAHDPRRAAPRPMPVAARRAALRTWGWALSLAAAAVLLLALGSGLRDPGRDGGPVSEGLRLSVVGETTALAERAWVDAGAESRELTLGDVGRVTLDAGSRLEVRRLAREETRLYLERGRLHALVSAEARPRFFQVDTPAARCVDLGCRYTLSVDAAGDALVEVETGQVAFESEGREVYVPAGARCRATRARGAGTPCWIDAEPALIAAAAAFDAAEGASADERRVRARALLAATTDGRASLCAWHLLQDGDERIVNAARARLVALAGPLEPVAGASAAEERERWKERLATWW